MIFFYIYISVMARKAPPRAFGHTYLFGVYISTTAQPMENRRKNSCICRPILITFHTTPDRSVFIIIVISCGENRQADPHEALILSPNGSASFPPSYPSVPHHHHSIRSSQYSQPHFYWLILCLFSFFCIFETLKYIWFN